MKRLNNFLYSIEGTSLEIPINLCCIIIMLIGTLGLSFLALDLYQILIRPLLISWAQGN